MIGGNDVVRLRLADNAAAALSPSLGQARAASDKTILLTAGNVGGARLIPWLLRPIYRWLNLSYHRELEQASAATGVTYVNLYTPPEADPFVLQPKKFLAVDEFHPSSDGYAV